MRRIIVIGVTAIGLTIAAPSRATDLSPLEGGWVADSAPCEALENHHYETILKIELPTMEFYESICQIRNASRNGSEYRLELLCSGEGETWRDSKELTLTSDDRLRIKDGFEYVRCY